MAKLLYGAGLRLMECIRLRIQDVDFGQNKIYVRGGKGGKDWLSVLPQNIRDELRFHIDRVIVQHHDDLVEGFGEVYLYPTHWTESIRMRQEKRVGNIFSPQKNDQLILGQVGKCVIMF